MSSIISNYHSREIVYGFELSDSERGEFDYYTEDELDDAEFFRYKGLVRNIADYMHVNKGARDGTEKWDGYSTDSYFSGTLIRFIDRGEYIQVARYTC